MGRAAETEASSLREHTTVAIVGGGPCGLTAALLLEQAGIDFLLLERRDFTTRFPRAHLLNVRTMEIFHDVGVADEIYARSPPEDRWHRVCWYTSLAGPSDLHGRKIGEVHAWGGGPDRPRYAKASPRSFANLPQLRLDTLLWRHADARSPGRIRAQQEVVDLKPDADGVTITVVDRESDERYAVRADYVIAADGGRVCAQLLGVDLKGPRAIRQTTSVYFEANLEAHADPEALLTYFISPAGNGGAAGTLQALGPSRWANESSEWLLGVSGIPRGTPPEKLVSRIRHVLGIDDLDVTVRAVSDWEFEGVIADHFRVGRAFLVGDAAHRHPPTGGLGLNTGVQDVFNLSWKLVAVLRGYASDALLETYEAERRPVAAFNIEHSLRNAAKHPGIAAAIGLRRGQTEEEGWRQIGIWASATPDGERRRAAGEAAVAANAEDYSQLNVEAGFAYELGALIPDGTPAPIRPIESPIEFEPSARPGHHLPHVWLMRDGARMSTVDLVADEGFTLFVADEKEQEWRVAAAAAAAETGCPLEVVGVGGALTDPEGEWSAVRGVGSSGVIIARPDKHVAWRADPVDRLREETLIDTLRGLLHGGVPEPIQADRRALLASIENAADRLR
jgi:2,4-dichlorophenol 6-monooxygenase